MAVVGNLTVVIPCYNEENTILTILEAVLNQPQVGEVIVIDDNSKDNSANLIRSLIDSRINLLENERNMGKGFSVSRGFSAATLPYVIIQDADLEYDPDEYGALLQPLMDGKADVVFGSRFLVSTSRRVLYYWHRLGNNLLTTLSNVCTNIDLTDMETCFKVMRIEIARSIEINENRFGLEPELTAKIAAMKVSIFEVPISYNGRTYEEGKKITWKDGFSAIRCILKYNSRREKKKQYLKYTQLNLKNA
jgi:glycosyltransferase involved in cell wall biosynthesis